MSVRKHNATLLIIVGEGASGKSRLTHLLIGDANDEKRKKSEGKENDGKDSNDNMVDKKPEGSTERLISPGKSNLLAVAASRIGVRNYN